MSPTHSNKRGVRYRYYVSHMLLQNRKSEAGSVPRVPAPEIEALVLDGVRKHLASTTELPTADRDLIDHYVERVIIRSQAVEVSIALEAGHANEESVQAETSASGDPATDPPRTATIKQPWSAPSFVVIKGIVHAPSTTSKMNPHRGEALLNAMAKARRWVEDLRLGRANSFANFIVWSASALERARLCPCSLSEPMDVDLNGSRNTGRRAFGICQRCANFLPDIFDL